MIPLLIALCQFSEPPRPAPPEQLIPPAAAVVLPPDRIAEGRPKVVMITAANCRPCAEAEAWMRTNGFPFEIDRRAPAAGDSTPTWRFQGADGKWWQVVGWQGRATVEALVRAYSEKNPQPVAARSKAPEKEALPDTLRRFAGETGTIVFRPDKKTRATVTDGVTLDVGEITARYDLRGEPRITFDSPQPRGTVEKFGFGIGFVLQSATYQAPDTVRVGTNWKTITVRLDDD